MELLILVLCFFTFMILGLPIAYNLLISSTVYMLVSGFDISVVGLKMFEGMNSFSFLAVPFFVITGQLMLKGGLLENLIDFVNAYFGRYKGAVIGQNYSRFCNYEREALLLNMLESKGMEVIVVSEEDRQAMKERTQQVVSDAVKAEIGENFVNQFFSRLEEVRADVTKGIE